MSIERISVNRWTITVQEDEATGDLYLPLDSEILESAGWAAGDTIHFEISTNETGPCVILSKLPPVATEE
jgi:hypothetical protein